MSIMRAIRIKHLKRSYISWYRDRVDRFRTIWTDLTYIHCEKAFPLVSVSVNGALSHFVKCYLTLIKCEHPLSRTNLGGGGDGGGGVLQKSEPTPTPWTYSCHSVWTELCLTFDQCEQILTSCSALRRPMHEDRVDRDSTAIIAYKSIEISANLFTAICSFIISCKHGKNWSCGAFLPASNRRFLRARDGSR